MIAGLRAATRAALYDRPPLGPVGRSLRPRAVVLVYHRVADAPFDPYGQAVAPESFARQLALLRRDYTVMALDELLTRLPRRAYPDRTVAVTFDDGYVDNLSHAAPIALRLGVPITIFVAVQPIVEGGRFWWDELALGSLARAGSDAPLVVKLGGGRELSISGEAAPAAVRAQLHQIMRRLAPDARRQAVETLRARADALEVGRPMDVDELRSCAALPGVTIGAHTLTHPALATRPAAEQRRELAEARRVLEELIGRPVRLLAYPFGKAADVSAHTRFLAEQAGYVAAMTTMPGTVVPTTPRYAIPRLTIHEWPDVEFARRLGALYGQ